MNHIILIGFMGCGKTSVGICLSYQLKLTIEDTDKIIEKQEKMTISEIFDSSGEESFRRLETESLHKLLEQREKRIISVGGGLPLRSENRALLKELGAVIYLRVTAETVCARLAGDTTRPLLQGENPVEKVRELLEERASIYEEAADITVDVDGKDFETIVDEIIKRMGEM